MRFNEIGYSNGKKGEPIDWCNVTLEESCVSDHRLHSINVPSILVVCCSRPSFITVVVVMVFATGVVVLMSHSEHPLQTFTESRLTSLVLRAGS